MLLGAVRNGPGEQRLTDPYRELPEVLHARAALRHRQQRLGQRRAGRAHPRRGGGGRSRPGLAPDRPGGVATGPDVPGVPGRPARRAAAGRLGTAAAALPRRPAPRRGPAERPGLRFRQDHTSHHAGHRPRTRHQGHPHPECRAAGQRDRAHLPRVHGRRDLAQRPAGPDAGRGPGRRPAAGRHRGVALGPRDGTRGVRAPRWRAGDDPAARRRRHACLRHRRGPRQGRRSQRRAVPVRDVARPARRRVQPGAAAVPRRRRRHPADRRVRGVRVGGAAVPLAVLRGGLAAGRRRLAARARAGLGAGVRRPARRRGAARGAVGLPLAAARAAVDLPGHVRGARPAAGLRHAVAADHRASAPACSCWRP